MTTGPRATSQRGAAVTDEAATCLLPEQPGWTAGPASLAEGRSGRFLSRTYGRGRMTAAVEVTAGPAAAAAVAMTMDFPPGEATTGQSGYRTWTLRGCKAHLVRCERGMAHTLGINLRGGAGDLPGSVRLEIRGRRLPPDLAVALALALDWTAITAALAGECALDPARVAAASHPAVTPAREGPLLWPMMPSPTSMERMFKLEQRRPPGFTVANMDQIAAARRAMDADQDRHLFACLPTPVLVIRQRSFAPDYLWPGLHFASARLRDALGLGPGDIEYRDVDASGSTAEARAADYKMFRVARQADPVDLRAMYGHEPDREADGSPTTAWLMSVSGPHATPRRTVWRDGFVPPAPLFRDRSGGLIATEALADRVMRAGIGDVVFQDVTSAASLLTLTLRPGPGDTGRRGPD